jgi:hypothetical protein
LFAQGEHDKWEQNEITGNKITGNEIKITGNKKRLKIKIQIQNKKKENKKTKSKKSQVPCFSMRGMDKKSEARKENLYTHIFLLLPSHLLGSLLSYAFTSPPSLPSPFHLGYFIRSYAFPPCVLMLFSHVCLSSTSASASPKHDPLGFVCLYT